MPTQIFSLILAVQAQIRRNEIVATSILSLSALSASGFIVAASGVCPRLLLGCCIGFSLAILWWVARPPFASLKVSLIRAAELLDQKLNAKERVVSFVELTSHASTSPQAVLLESQLARLLPPSASPQTIAPYSMRRSEKRSLIASAFFIAAALMLYALRPSSEFERIANSIEKVVLQNPDIPENVRREAQTLISTMTDPTKSVEDIKTALRNTQQSIEKSKVSPSSKSPTMSGSENSSTLRDQPASSNSSPEATPTPVETEKRNSDLAQQRPEQAKQEPKGGESSMGSQQQRSPASDGLGNKTLANDAHNDAQMQKSAQKQPGVQQDGQNSDSPSGNESSQKDSNKKGDQKESKGSDQGESQKADSKSGQSGSGSDQNNTQDNSQQKKSGGTKSSGDGHGGTGEGEGQGEGTAPSQSGSPSGASQGAGEKSNQKSGSPSGEPSGTSGNPSNAGERSDSTKTQSGTEKLEQELSKAQSELSRSEQQRSGVGQGVGDSAQKNSGSQDGSKDPSKPGDTPGKSEKEERNTKSSQSAKGQPSDQGSANGDKSPSQKETSQSPPQSPPGVSKKSDAQSPDSKAPGNMGKESQSPDVDSQGQEASSASIADQREQNNNPGKEGARDGTGGNSPQVDRNAKTREGGLDGPPGPGLGEKESFKEVHIDGANETLDSRFTGDQSDIEASDLPAQPKTTIEDVILAKPKSSSQKTEQQIPLEYRDVLK